MLLKRIIDLRDEYSLTQEKMAEILGVKKSTYGRWETDEILISLWHLNDLCNYFNVSMDYMIGISNVKCYKLVNNKLNNELIGKRLKEFRINNDLTQEELSKSLNTTQSVISDYENGKTRVLTAFAYEIVMKYNISLDWLCGRID